MIMRRTLIRYKTKPDRTAENEALIKAVFAELHATAPEGLRYMSLKFADGSFVHFVENDAKDPAGVLQSLTAFQAFLSGIRDRCIEPPQSDEVTIVGNYRMLASHESLASA
jgi:hypothetical protein